jgi:hypothetical protein
MPWPVHPNGLLGAQGDNDTYKIERSLRFNSDDSAYLNRTNGAGTNRKTFTWSGWVKRSAISSSSSYTLMDVNSGSAGTPRGFLSFGNDNLSFSFNSTGAAFDALLTTTQVFRDVSAWYHLVFAIDTTQATSSNRIKIYVNGVEITTFSTATYPAQNTDSPFNTTYTYQIGRVANNLAHFNGYLTEINFIDGQALTPSSFGETDAITGRWKAKAYSGTYGTNGFYLKFADNSGTTSTTLGKDSSPNGNNWTPNNFSVTAGAGNDSLVDSPTNYGKDTGVGGEVRGNYCTINAIFNLNGGVTSDGNLVLTSQNAGGTSAPNGTIGVKSGKWYFEMQAVSNGGFGQPYAGINNGSLFGRFTGNGASSPFTTYGTYGVAFDVDAGKLWLTDSTGAWVSSGSPSTGANPLETFSGGLETFPYCAGARTSGNNASAIGRWNFGQRPFAYTAPTGFKALCTTNLTTPTIKKPSSYFDAVTYTGTGASNSISSLGFSPDLVWIKNRGGATSHAIYDTARGTQAQLSSDTTGDEVTSSTGLTAFGSNGFTIGTSSLVNTSGTQYVAWSWDEAPIAGMDIVSYTGNGANRTIAHNLGVAPKMMIVKARVTASTDQGWPVYHTGVASDAETDYLLLNSTAAAADLNTVWNDTAPTSSVFSVGTNALVNTNNDTYIAYLFAEVEGFSKIGSYIGNGSADGPFVYCGFRPRCVMYKRTDSVENWCIIDTARDTFNVSGSQLTQNSSSAEGTGSSNLDTISNGFKIRSATAGGNVSGGTYIFAAFAESPFKYARAR